MGKRSDFTARKNDAYLTWDKRALPPLLPHLQGRRFVEPCAGAGHLVDQLEAAGYECAAAYDIDPQRFDIEHGDALHAAIDEGADFYVSNPPWTRQILHPLIERLAQRKVVWFLFDADWAHTKQARPYLARYCHTIVSVGRLRWVEGSDHDGKDNCAWYQFGPGASGTQRFIPRG